MRLIVVPLWLIVSGYASPTSWQASFSSIESLVALPLWFIQSTVRRRGLKKWSLGKFRGHFLFWFSPLLTGFYLFVGYLASYLIIKQLKNSRNVEKEEETEFDGEGVVSDFSHHGCTTFDKERQLSNMPCSPLTDTTMVPTDSYQVR